MIDDRYQYNIHMALFKYIFHEGESFHTYEGSNPIGKKDPLHMRRAKCKMHKKNLPLRLRYNTYIYPDTMVSRRGS